MFLFSLFLFLFLFYTGNKTLAITYHCFETNTYKLEIRDTLLKFQNANNLEIELNEKVLEYP